MPTIPESPDPEVIRAIGVIEETGNDFVDAHTQRTGLVHLHNIVSGMRAPESLQPMFTTLGWQSPETVDAMSLTLAFDDHAGRFDILRGSVNFDNGFGIAMSPPAPSLSHGAMMHETAFTFRNKDEITTIPSWPISHKNVKKIIQDCGVYIPTSPFPGSLTDLSELRVSAEEFAYYTQRRAWISPTRELVVTSSIEELHPPFMAAGLPEPGSTDRDRGPVSDAALDGDSPTYMHEVKIGLHDLKGGRAITHEAVLRSTTPDFKPAFLGAYRHIEDPRSQDTDPHPTLIFPEAKLLQRMVEAMQSVARQETI